MGITSTGSGKAPEHRSTSLPSSMMQTNRLEAAAIDLFARQRGTAALDQHAIRGGFVGAVDIQIRDRPTAFKSSSAMPAARARSDV